MESSTLSVYTKEECQQFIRTAMAMGFTIREFTWHRRMDQTFEVTVACSSEELMHILDTSRFLNS